MRTELARSIVETVIDVSMAVMVGCGAGVAATIVGGWASHLFKPELLPLFIEIAPFFAVPAAAGLAMSLASLVALEWVRAAEDREEQAAEEMTDRMERMRTGSGRQDKTAKPSKEKGTGL